MVVDDRRATEIEGPVAVGGVKAGVDARGTERVHQSRDAPAWSPVFSTNRVYRVEHRHARTMRPEARPSMNNTHRVTNDHSTSPAQNSKQLPNHRI